MKPLPDAGDWPRLSRRHHPERKISPRIPGALIALAAATFAAPHFNLEEQGVSVVGSFTVAPPHLPRFPILDDLSRVLGLAVSSPSS